jgi:hypothetical protein
MPFEEMLQNKHYRTGILCGASAMFLLVFVGSFFSLFCILIGVGISLVATGISILLAFRDRKR